MSSQHTIMSGVKTLPAFAAGEAFFFYAAAYPVFPKG